MHDFNEPKRALLRKSSEYRSGLEDEVKLISEKTEKIIINALVIGGALALSYIVVRQFSKPKSKGKAKVKKIKLVSDAPKEEVEETYAEESRISRVVSEIGAALTSQATAFLLAVAREKLMEYLQAQAEKKSLKDEHS